MGKRITAAIVLLLASPVLAEFPAEHPWPEVTYKFEKKTDPAEEVHVAIVDLSDHNAVVRVTRGGEDPDGAGPAETTLMGTTKIADREHFDIAVNGDYFGLVKSPNKDAEGAAAQSVFVKGSPATVIGPAMTDGVQWAKPAQPRPALIVHKDGTVSIASISAAPKDAAQIIAGNVMLVEKGKALYQDEPDENFVKQKNTNRQRHPRTLVGVSRDGKKLFIVVVDGRSKISAGMNWKELGKEMADLGAYNALNLDGGGSSTFTLRDPDSGEIHILNHPSDGKERSVGNVLGVRITRPAK